MTAKETEATIEASNGKSLVFTREGDQFVVRWLCGGTRTFTHTDIVDAVTHLEQLAPFGLWMQAHDSNGTAYAARVAGGRLYAGDSPTDAPELAYVPWRSFKAAVGVKPDKPPPADYVPPSAIAIVVPDEAPAWISTAPPKRGLLRRLFRPGTHPS